MLMAIYDQEDDLTYQDPNTGGGPFMYELHWGKIPSS